MGSLLPASITCISLPAEAYGQAEQPAAALRVVAEALTVVDHTEERLWEAEWYRLKGRLLDAQTADSRVGAEAAYQYALAIARRQPASSRELRAALSLSRLWQQQGKWDEARALLAPIHGWFTEGFDTADLQEAKALLDALA